MKPTPNTLRPFVLRILGAQADMKAGVAVKGSSVADQVIRDAKIEPAEEEKARIYTNWLVSNKFKPEGLIATDTKKGWWALTDAGVEAARNETPPEEPETVTAAPVAPVPSMPVSSPWADDTAGQAIFTQPVTDTYSPDPYIKALGCKVECFGSFSETEQVCVTCPLASSCRSSQFMTLSAIATQLRKRDAERAAREAAQTLKGSTASNIVPAKVTVHSEESLEDLLRDLEGSPAPPPRPATPPAPATPPDEENGMRMPAQVESKCYRCRGIIPEKSIGIYVPSLGMRHETCP